MGEINKSTTVQVEASATLDVKWISGATEPTTPEGYERLTDFDITLQFSILDMPFEIKLWAFKKTS